MRNEIRALRTARQLSQQQLAEAMDVSRQTINSIEKERYTPSLPLAIALARFFETTLEEVFDADGIAVAARRCAVSAAPAATSAGRRSTCAPRRSPASS
jgi:putative transcriptional regulator